MYIVLTYFASFTGYKENIFEVISNLHVQRSKLARKFEKFGEKRKKKKIELCGVHGDRFFPVCNLIGNRP